jgi:hypothetical protein
MEETTTHPTALAWRTQPLTRVGLLGLTLLVLLAAFLAYRAWTTGGTEMPESTADYLSVDELEERYGLAVRLIGVTGGGGMIDFRLKILDAKKAQDFLQDPEHLPRLIAADTDTPLVGTQGLEDDVNWEEGGILFILFSNSGGAIKTGNPVIVEFSSLQLEPILAQ